MSRAEDRGPSVNTGAVGNVLMIRRARPTERPRGGPRRHQGAEPHALEGGGSTDDKPAEAPTELASQRDAKATCTDKCMGGG